MAKHKATSTADYDALLSERKNYTEKIKKCTAENYVDFSALFAANCWLKDIPEDVACQYVQNELQRPDLNNEIAVIIQRTYSKRQIENTKKPASEVSKNPAPIKPSKSRNEKKVDSNADERKSSMVVDSKKEIAFTKDVAKAMREIYLERLPNLSYSDLFIKKLMVFYDTIESQGENTLLFDVGIRFGFQREEIVELLENLRRLKLLVFTIEDTYKKELPMRLLR